MSFKDLLVILPIYKKQIAKAMFKDYYDKYLIFFFSSASFCKILSGQLVLKMTETETMFGSPWLACLVRSVELVMRAVRSAARVEAGPAVCTAILHSRLATGPPG